MPWPREGVWLLVLKSATGESAGGGRGGRGLIAKQAERRERRRNVGPSTALFEGALEAGGDQGLRFRFALGTLG